MREEDISKYKNKIKMCRLFAGMKEEELDLFLQHKNCEIKLLEKDEILAGSFIYIILEGSIRIEKEASDGRVVVLNIVEPVNAINITAAFGGEKKMLSLMRAESKSLCLKADESAVRDAVARGGVFALNITDFLAGRICFLNKKITSFAGYSADRRLHGYLIENCVNGVVEIPFSWTEFAEHLGVGRASLYRALDNMEAEGIIKKEKRKIRIVGELK